MSDVCKNLIANTEAVQEFRTFPRKQTSNLSIKYIKPNIGLHSFHTDHNDLIFSIHILSMDNSVLMWIGKGLDPILTDLSVAMMSPFQNTPLASKVIGSALDTASLNLASKLTKKLNKQVFLSCSIILDKLTAPMIEKRIIEEIKRNPENF